MTRRAALAGRGPRGGGGGPPGGPQGPQEFLGGRWWQTDLGVASLSPEGPFAEAKAKQLFSWPGPRRIATLGMPGPRALGPGLGARP